MITGRLLYDPESDRYQVVDDAGGVMHPGLHCGELLEVLSDGEYHTVRIEYDSCGWYLVGMPCRGCLDNLEVRM